jgi:hypothetical protein
MIDFPSEAVPAQVPVSAFTLITPPIPPPIPPPLLPKRTIKFLLSQFPIDIVMGSTQPITKRQSARQMRLDRAALDPCAEVIGAYPARIQAREYVDEGLHLGLLGRRRLCGVLRGDAMQ